MTFGIDVSAGQAGIDFKKAKSEGVEFVVVKAAGFNTKPLYVADHYAAHVDAARAAGINNIGHYYIPGKGDVSDQADFFVKHLHKIDPDHDILALDNEPLDSNKVFWKQAAAFEWLSRVKALTGIPWNRLWFYAPAALCRANGPWDDITGKGIRVWWSAYGQHPTGKSPDSPPELQGKIARWDVHQFTDSSKVAGLTVDGDYSKLSANLLFNRTPAPTPAQAATTSYATALKPVSGDGWAFKLPGTALTTRIQRALGARGRYKGPANGKFNLDTAKGVQTTIKNVGYTGAVDGKIEERSCNYIQQYAKKFGGYAGPIDQELGTYSWTGFAVGLEKP